MRRSFARTFILIPGSRGVRRAGRPAMPKKDVRYAVVGLGWFAQEGVLPAFATAKRSSLAAIVSDDPEKLAVLAKRYDVPNAVDYDGYDALLSSGEIDAVYLVVPNAQHLDFAVRTLNAKIPLLLEKPMAVTEAECRALLDAAGKTPLMVAYRLHFEPANLAALAAVRAGKIGALRSFHSTFTMQVDDGNTRLRPSSEGGGPLFDIGTYCINAARTLFEAEPEEVMAFAASPKGDERFAETHEQVSATLRFPGDRLASFQVGFGASKVSRYTILGTEGRVTLDPAYSFSQGLKLELEVGDKRTRRSFPKRDQVSPEISYFSKCIQTKKKPEPGALEGLLDVRVIEALELSIDTGRPITLPAAPHEPRPTPAQEAHAPAHPKVKLVNAEPAHG